MSARGQGLSFDLYPRSHRFQQFLISFGTTGPIEAKFHMEQVGGIKIFSNSLGHMTMMAPMPIYCKNL